jgi:hypothetical protein
MRYMRDEHYPSDRLMDSAQHVIGCHLTQGTMVHHVFIMRSTTWRALSISPYTQFQFPSSFPSSAPSGTQVNFVPQLPGRPPVPPVHKVGRCRLIDSELTALGSRA